MAVNIEKENQLYKDSQHINKLGSTSGSTGATNNPDPGTNLLTGDDALLKAMEMQIIELSSLTDAATSESSLSVTMRKVLQGRAQDKVTEIEKLLNLCSSCEGSNWDTLSKFVNRGDQENYNFNALKEAFPNVDLDGVSPDDVDDFMSRLKNLTQGLSVSEFRSNVGQLNSVLNQYSTYVTSTKNLADAYQTGASNLTQSITQFLAQLATESGLMSDVVAQ